VAQRVERETTLPYRLAAGHRALSACAAGVPVDPDDLDALNFLHDHLQIPVNNAPALFRPGDGQVLALARVRCSECRAVVAVVNALDARPRRGPLVYEALTSHRPSQPGGAMRQVYVVLGAPGNTRGRPPIPRPTTVLTTCRAHGVLTVPAGKLLGEAQRALSALDADREQRQPIVTARPMR
jgi:hypothetical protein